MPSSLCMLQGLFVFSLSFDLSNFFCVSIIGASKISPAEIIFPFNTNQLHIKSPISDQSKSTDHHVLLH